MLKNSKLALDFFYIDSEASPKFGNTVCFYLTIHLCLFLPYIGGLEGGRCTWHRVARMHAFVIIAYILDKI